MFVLLCALFVLSSCETTFGYGGQSICGRVHITVSSVPDTYLVLNWVTDCSVGEVVPEYIILSSKNVLDRYEYPDILHSVKFSDYPGGYYKTKIKFGHPWLPGGWEYDDGIENSRADPGLHCFPYWIASIRGNFTIDSRCFGIQPTWMFDNSKTIGNLKIGSMFIPGTHNSGAFMGIPAFLGDYVLCQDRDVWTQLTFGIRYLDFRIGYYGNEGFFINHDLIRVAKIAPIFQQIRKFLQKAPKEIIVIDLHRFPYPTNFTIDIHKKFVDILHRELGEYALPSKDLQVGKGPTLNEIWSKNKNLIICYSDKTTVRDNDWLWHPLQQFWGNTRKVDELQRFLEKSIHDHRLTTMNPLWALMAELTPSTFDIVFRTRSLRKLAEDVNGKLTTWFRDDWGKQSNIVATDFFLGNDLINIAIKINNLNS